MAKNKSEELSQLGQKTELPESPEAAVLESVPNPHPDSNWPDSAPAIEHSLGSLGAVSYQHLTQPTTPYV